MTHSQRPGQNLHTNVQKQQQQQTTTTICERVTNSCRCLMLRAIYTSRKNGMTPPQLRALLHHHDDANTVEKAQLRWSRHDISSQRFSRETCCGRQTDRVHQPHNHSRHTLHLVLEISDFKLCPSTEKVVPSRPEQHSVVTLQTRRCSPYPNCHHVLNRGCVRTLMSATDK